MEMMECLLVEKMAEKMAVMMDMLVVELKAALMATSLVV
jgi:hypothetical protein